ncbi:MAG: HD domain-containing protein, partial [Deltaproteobacteria bacterium]|nr:HD domain-containing protein [Deltaproteobacteria bacterium]
MVSFPDQLDALRAWVLREPLFGLLKQIADRLGCTLFLTGGLVRDWLLNRQTRDVDLAVSGSSLALAEAFAESTGGTYVLLKKEEETARVVTPDLVFDFAGFRAPTLEGDLRHRDFTVNSIALSLSAAFGTGPWEPFDPLAGIDDLQRKRLRICHPEAFNQDPLRLLRAFRLSGQLHLTITPDTRQAIRKWAPALERTAPERQCYEWELILDQPTSFPLLALMAEDGLLEILLPELIPLRETPQNGFHHLDVHGHTLLSFQSLEEVLGGAFPLPPDLAGERDRYLVQGHYPAWLKWSILAHDLGKPATADRKEGRLTFYHHDRTGQEIFQGLAQRLRLGLREKDFILRLIGLHLRPFHLLQLQTGGKLSRRAVLRFVREAGEDLTGIFLVALADSLAARGPDKPPDLEERLLELWQECLPVREALGRPGEQAPPLITGRDLIRLGYPPGPLFKTI